MSSVVMEMFDDVALTVLRVLDRQVIYRKNVDERPELTAEVVDRAVGLANLPSLPRLLSVEAEVSPSLVAIVRYFGSSALIVVCERDHRREAKFRLDQFDQCDLVLFGGGLSNSGLDAVSLFGEDEVTPGPCTASAVAEFLNESFDFLFSLTNQSLRVAYCRSFGNRYEFLSCKGGTLIATDELHILDEQQQADIDYKFARMVEAVELEKLQSLKNSPITSPPWRRNAAPTLAQEAS